MSDSCQPAAAGGWHAAAMDSVADPLVDRFLLACAEFERRLPAARSDRWSWPTPCAEWNVRQLVNHMARGNLNYVGLLRGGTAAEFVRLRDADALGTDPVGAFGRSARACTAAFVEPGALARVLDHPLGAVTGRQALAVRITDSTVHTWDLARAVGADDRLDPELVTWIDDNFAEIYANLPETPTDAASTHRFFAAARTGHDDESRQDRLLRLTGRRATERSVPEDPRQESARRTS
jgi:uncharacterized protein (TIGR03086 family)